MGKLDKALENAVKELQQFFSGRLAGPIEVKYGVIHLQIVGNLTSEDVEAVHRALKAHAQAVHRWRVQQLNNMLLLSVVTEDSRSARTSFKRVR